MTKHIPQLQNDGYHGPWLAPAKLNLFLYVCGRRSDGYHDLQTLFQFIDSCDELYFKLNDSGRCTMAQALEGVNDDDNLVIRAAKLLQAHCKVSHGVSIRLNKHLPMGGGIGGGSSDAATTLLVLNQLWQCQLSLDELARLGLSLGADVPVFIQGRAAFAQGVGENLMPITLDEPWYLVLHPRVHVCTASVFQHANLYRSSPKRDWETLKNLPFHNDCQELVLELYPKVANALSWLLEYAPSHMSGTGSCVFARFASQAHALSALQHMPRAYHGFVCQGHNHSILHQQLAQFVTLDAPSPQMGGNRQLNQS